MKKIGQIMEEMGFNKNAPDSVKEAFIKHLVQASSGIRPEEKQSDPHQSKIKYQYSTEPIQLSFFDEINKKVI